MVWKDPCPLHWQADYYYWKVVNVARRLHHFFKLEIKFTSSEMHSSSGYKSMSIDQCIYPCNLYPYHFFFLNLFWDNYMHLYKIIQRALNPVLFTSIAPSSTIFVQLSEPGYWHWYSGDRTFPSLTKPLSGHTHSPPTIISPLAPNNHSSVLHFHNFVISSEVAQSCPTLCNPLDHNI